MATTPAPWFVHTVPGNSRLRIGSDTYDIAEVCPAGGNDAANARLIANAPAIVETMRETVAKWDANPDDLETMDECVRRMREFITSVEKV
jgi:hypothetical protein